MHIYTRAITGQESVTETDSPYAALVAFYQAFNQRNQQLMQQNWLATQAASMSNPVGGVKRGWHEISKVYEKIFHGPAQVYVEFYDYSIHESESMFCAVGHERGELRLNRQAVELAIRTTRIYCRYNNQWQQIHHHGSMDNPELLHKYQTTLLNN